jgi:hypothetical protein
MDKGGVNERWITEGVQMSFSRRSWRLSLASPTTILHSCVHCQPVIVVSTHSSGWEWIGFGKWDLRSETCSLGEINSCRTPLTTPAVEDDVLTLGRLVESMHPRKVTFHPPTSVSSSSEREGGRN